MVLRCLPLEIPRYSDLAVDQGLHHPADHLIKRSWHVLAKFALKATLHILPVTNRRQNVDKSLMGNIFS